MHVAFQGETGAFSEEAVLSYFSDEDDLELLPRRTFDEVFQSLSEGGADRAVIPIENSLHGSVHSNYDRLRDWEVQIVGELYMRIVHHLMGVQGSSLSAIQQVLSHPQAIGQCRESLQKRLPEAEYVPAYDTAGAAKMVAETGDPELAAIASEAAAREYGLDILIRGLEHNRENYTRFLVLSRDRELPREEVAAKTSVVYAMKQNVPGALFKSLAAFSLREIDLFKIESRPLVGSPWEYLFYLDFDGSVQDEIVQRAIEHLSEITAFQQVLGSYAKGEVVN